MNPKSSSDVERRFARIVATLSKQPGVTVGGKGFGASGLKVRGKLFAMVSSTGMFVAKLPSARVDELVRLGHGEYFNPGHGRLMKQWIAIHDESLWMRLAREAYQFVRGNRR